MIIYFDIDGRDARQNIIERNKFRDEKKLMSEERCQQVCESVNLHYEEDQTEALQVRIKSKDIDLEGFAAEIYHLWSIIRSDAHDSEFEKAVDNLAKEVEAVEVKPLAEAGL